MESMAKQYFKMKLDVHFLKLWFLVICDEMLPQCFHDIQYANKTFIMMIILIVTVSNLEIF